MATQRNAGRASSSNSAAALPLGLAARAGAIRRAPCAWPFTVARLLLPGLFILWVAAASALEPNTAIVSSSSDLYAALSTDTVSIVYLIATLRLNSSNWDPPLLIRRNVTIAAHPRFQDIRIYVTLDLASLAARIHLQPGIELRFVWLELTNYVVELGQTMLLVGPSPGARVVFDTVIQHRRAGLSSARNLEDILALPLLTSAAADDSDGANDNQTVVGAVSTSGSSSAKQKAFIVPRFDYNVSRVPAQQTVTQPVYIVSLATPLPTTTSRYFAPGVPLGGYHMVASDVVHVSDEVTGAGCGSDPDATELACVTQALKVQDMQPVVVTTKRSDSNLVKIVASLAILLVAVLLFLYFRRHYKTYQQRRARRMRRMKEALGMGPGAHGILFNGLDGEEPDWQIMPMPVGYAAAATGSEEQGGRGRGGGGGGSGAAVAAAAAGALARHDSHHLRTFMKDIQDASSRHCDRGNNNNNRQQNQQHRYGNHVPYGGTEGTGRRTGGEGEEDGVVRLNMAECPIAAEVGLTLAPAEAGGGVGDGGGGNQDYDPRVAVSGAAGGDTAQRQQQQQQSRGQGQGEEQHGDGARGMRSRSRGGLGMASRLTALLGAVQDGFGASGTTAVGSASHHSVTSIISGCRTTGPALAAAATEAAAAAAAAAAAVAHGSYHGYSFRVGSPRMVPPPLAVTAAAMDMLLASRAASMGITLASDCEYTSTLIGTGGVTGSVSVHGIGSLPSPPTLFLGGGAAASPPAAAAAAATVRAAALVKTPSRLAQRDPRGPPREGDSSRHSALGFVTVGAAAGGAAATGLGLGLAAAAAAATAAGARFSPPVRRANEGSGRGGLGAGTGPIVVLRDGDNNGDGSSSYHGHHAGGGGGAGGDGGGGLTARGVAAAAAANRHATTTFAGMVAERLRQSRDDYDSSGHDGGGVEEDDDLEATAALPVASPQVPPNLLDELEQLKRDLMAGIRDTQLQILSVVGCGAFGTVYRGQWQGLEVAVKTVVFSASSENRKRALQEAALCQSINHRNIVATYAVDVQPLGALNTPAVPPAPLLLMTAGTSMTQMTQMTQQQQQHQRNNDPRGTSTLSNLLDWRLYIVQEYCDGGPLRKLVQSGHLHTASGPNMPVICEVALELSQALAHLHSKNIIHGDLNPNNVLLKRDASSPNGFRVKVADFGLSVMVPLQKTHMSNLRLGTLYYIAPETCFRGQLGYAADVFAMGVMLWELYHGRLAGTRTPTGEPRYQPDFPDFPAACPADYRKLAHRCLQKQPHNRLHSSQVVSRLQEMIAAYRAAAAAAGAPPAPPLPPLPLGGPDEAGAGAAPVPPLFAQHHNAAAAAVGTAAATATAAGAGMLRGGGEGGGRNNARSPLATPTESQHRAALPAPIVAVAVAAATAVPPAGTAAPAAVAAAAGLEISPWAPGPSDLARVASGRGERRRP